MMMPLQEKAAVLIALLQQVHLLQFYNFSSILTKFFPFVSDLSCHLPSFKSLFLLLLPFSLYDISCAVSFSSLTLV